MILTPVKDSVYCKDELPTWDELYNEFCLPKAFRYDPDDETHQILDPYWKVPRRKVLLAFCCNQLNKIIFEGGLSLEAGAKTQFILMGPGEHYQGNYISLDPNNKKPPPIYRFLIPSTKKESIFILNDHPRIKMEKFTGTIELVIFHNLSDDSDTPPQIILSTDARFSIMFSYVLKDVITYFENGVGWKDHDGKIIPSESSNPGCIGVGVDPAL